jgi:FkbM family methyltransferase
MKILSFLNRLLAFLIGYRIKFYKSYKKINIHKKQASNGLSLLEDFNFIESNTKIDIKIFFEIGANYCQDSFFAFKFLKLKKNNIYCFEPVSHIYNDIKSLGFNIYPLAVSNFDGNSFININEDSNSLNNSGLSSLKTSELSNISIIKKSVVECIRMDSFIKQNKISTIDFVKIDVEGNDFEVIEGFGDKIDIVKAIQVETSNISIFNDEKTIHEIYNYLISRNFVLAKYYLSINNIQGDALFVNKKYLK